MSEFKFEQIKPDKAIRTLGMLFEKAFAERTALYDTQLRRVHAEHSVGRFRPVHFDSKLNESWIFDALTKETLVYRGADLERAMELTKLLEEV